MPGPRWIVPFALVILPSLGCDDPAAPDGAIEGDWGGEHVTLSAAAGEAALEYDCAHGMMELPVAGQGDGRFVATGTHTIESGGPVQLGEPPDIHPARYDGRIVGDTMTLTVTLTDSGAPVGSFSLTRGSDGRLFKCL